MAEELTALIDIQELVAELEETNDLSASIDGITVVSGGGGDVPTYTGAYDVVPKVTQQTLPTANKRMTRDVTVMKIPYYEVSNKDDGETVYIGKEIVINGD